MSNVESTPHNLGEAIERLRNAGRRNHRKRQILISRQRTTVDRRFQLAPVFIELFEQRPPSAEPIDRHVGQWRSR